MGSTDFTSLPLNVLATIAKMCYDEDFNYGFPYDDYNGCKEILEQSSSWVFDGDITSLDVEFIAKLIGDNSELFENNDLKQLKKLDVVKTLRVPQVKTFQVYYDVWGPATYTESYKTDFKTYDKAWIEESIQEGQNEGTWNHYDGDYLGHEVDNFDSDNFAIQEIEEIQNINESLLSKLIFENTSEVLNDIDEQTLIKLRNLINQRLSS